MPRQNGSVRLRAGEALKHLFGRQIQVHDVIVDLDRDGYVTLTDKRAADTLLAQEHWSVASPEVK